MVRRAGCELTNEAAWKAAHSRLYDHLRDTTQEGQTPTLADLAPLYHAIAHGCRAGRHQEALEDVYTNRICRRQSDGEFEFYSYRKLGAMSSDLAAISWFFDRPYETPAEALSQPARAFVLDEASLCAARARAPPGGAAGAVASPRTWTKWRRIGKMQQSRASNLSETELLVGEIVSRFGDGGKVQ